MCIPLVDQMCNNNRLPCQVGTLRRSLGVNLHTLSANQVRSLFSC